MPFTSRTSWRAKLEKPQERKLVPIPARMRKQCGEGTMLIPRPLDVDAEVRAVRRGRLITTGEIRRRLAKRFGANTACPLCTGIFLRIAAEAAEEDARAGRKQVTPWWRVVGQTGALNPKFPGGAAQQAKRLRAEGHRITFSADRAKASVVGFGA